MLRLKKLQEVVEKQQKRNLIITKKKEMNNTQKILISIGVGVGLAYIYKKFYGKSYSANGTKETDGTKSANGTFQLPEESVLSNLTREEKEEFVLDNVFATPQEVSSGFEGVRFVWNPTLEKMYPVGTIAEGQEPNFGDIFNSAEGEAVADIPQSVQNAEVSLKDLNDQELELLFRIVKKQKENPSIMSEEDALKELGISNPNIIKVVRQKLKKRLNDIKIMKKDANWSEKWESRKESRKKRRNDFKEKMGFDKDTFDKVVAKKCGRKPKKGQEAQYKRCVEMVADKMRSQIKNEVRKEVESAPVSVKNEINSERQQSFAKQVSKRESGAMYGGERWDGESNAYVNNLVDKGLM